MQSIHKQANESFEIFARRIVGLVRKTGVDWTEQNDPFIIQYFINGLPSEISIKVSARKPGTLQLAVEKAKVFDEEINRKKQKLIKPVLALLESNELKVDTSQEDQKDSKIANPKETDKVTLTSLSQQIKGTNQKIFQQMATLGEKIERLDHQKQTDSNQINMLEAALKTNVNNSDPTDGNRLVNYYSDNARGRGVKRNYNQGYDRSTLGYNPDNYDRYTEKAILIIVVFRVIVITVIPEIVIITSKWTLSQ